MKVSGKARWWCTSLIPVLRRQRQMDLSESKARLVYRERSRTTRAIQRNHVSKKKSPSREKVHSFATGRKGRGANCGWDVIYERIN